MRVLAIAMIAALGACASAGVGARSGAVGDNPFAVARGSALPPPAASASGQAAPPEGRASAGIDFGQWRNADPAVYSPQFQTQMRQRYAGQSADQARADLEANGFACADTTRLECRIEIMERQCGIEWYVVIERTRPEPIAGHDVMCLGAL